MNFEQFIDSQSWVFAKTYAAKAPHEYIVRDKIAGTDEDFKNAIIFIRENGFVGQFWGKEHIYYYYNHRFYWTMGDPIDKTIIINRCEADDYTISMYPKRFSRKEQDVLQGE